MRPAGTLIPGQPTTFQAKAKGQMALAVVARSSSSPGPRGRRCGAAASRGRGEDDVAALEDAADPAPQARLGGAREAQRQAAAGPCRSGRACGCAARASRGLRRGRTSQSSTAAMPRGNDRRADQAVVGVGADDLVAEVGEPLGEGFDRRAVLGIDLVGDTERRGEGERDPQAAGLSRRRLGEGLARRLAAGAGRRGRCRGSRRAAGRRRRRCGRAGRSS